MSDLILKLLILRLQSCWPKAEVRGPIRLSRGQIKVSISNHSFIDIFI